MRSSRPLSIFIFCSIVTLFFLPTSAVADNHEHGEACVGFGPQTPRDIDSKVGTNTVRFPVAPSHDLMNLCNIHFHKYAEHKAAAFSKLVGEGDQAGYQCAIAETLSAAETKAPNRDICGGLQPGDTIEVHWVHSSCTVAPGPGLGSCLSDSCANPSLRVETQVFTLVSEGGMDFADFGVRSEGGDYHQAKAIPSGTGTPVVFLGSTTGPSYTEATCSPLQVTWSVRPECAKLDIVSVGEWCDGNVFEETSAHGVRKLVTNPALLAPIF